MSKVYDKIRDLMNEKNGLSEKDANLIVDAINTLKKYDINEEQLLNNIENIKFHYRHDTFSEDRQKDIVEFVKSDFSLGLSSEVEVNYRGDTGWERDCSKTKGIVNVLSVRESHKEEGIFNDKTFYTLGIGGTYRYRGFGNIITSELTKECLEDHGRKFAFDFLRESCMSPYREILMNYDKEYLVKNFFDMDSDFFKKESNINLDKALDELEVKINKAIFDKTTFKSIEEIPAAMDRARHAAEFNWMSYVVDYVPTVNKAMCEYFADKQYLYGNEQFEQLKNDLSKLPFFDREYLDIMDKAREVNKVNDNDKNILFEIADYDNIKMNELKEDLPSIKYLKENEFESYRQMLSERDVNGMTPFDKAIINADNNGIENVQYLSELISKINATDYTSGNIEFNNQKILLEALDKVVENGYNDYSKNVLSAFKDATLNEKTLIEVIIDKGIDNERLLNSIREDVLYAESKNGNILNYVSQQENVNFELMDRLIDRKLDVNNVNEQGKNILHNIVENNQSIELKNIEIEDSKSFFKRNSDTIDINTFSQSKIVQKLINNGIDVNVKNPENNLRPLDIVVGINIDEKIVPNRELVDVLVKNNADIDNCLSRVMENKDFDTLKVFINHDYKLDDMLKSNLEASSDFSDKDINKLMKYEEKVIGIKNKENATSYERDEYIKKGLDNEDGVNWMRKQEAEEDRYFGH